MTTSNDTIKEKNTKKLKPEETTSINDSPVSKSTSVPHPNFISRSIPFIVAIAISTTIAILYTNTHLTQQEQQWLGEIQQLDQEQATLKTHNKQALTAFEEQVEQRIAVLKKAIESTAQERTYKSNDWMMLKARYYLELAIINSHWTNDLATSEVLLHEADTVLAAIPGENLTEVRQAIAKEQVELAQIPRLDTAGLLSQLYAIQDLITTLTPQTTEQAPAPQVTSSTTSPATWRDQIKINLKKLDRLIVIRHQDDALAPLLTPAYLTMLRENIRLNLQEAQWAVLQRNQAVYQLAITQIIENIKRGFNVSDAKTAAMVTQLNALKAQLLVQPKPDLGQSLVLLNAQLQANVTTGAAL